MMKIERGQSGKDLSCAEVELANKIKALFGHCPELAGFSVLDSDGWPDDNEAADEVPSIIVSDVGLSIRVSRDEIDKVYNQIANAISDVLSERPEAIELLRGHTFARTLH